MKPQTTKTRLPEAEDFEILSIDQNLLDREWLNQPRFFFQYARQLADARRSYEEAKANLKLVAAEADQKVRERASQMEQKVTEAMIAAAVLRRNDYREAEQAVFTAKHNMDVLDAAVEALRHRKDALENLVRLHGQNYFSEPRATGDNKSMVDDMRMRRTVKDRNRK
jgi:Na+-translocating ferredoxin:NAD+ oxidoreductase RnfC subunit